MGYFLLTGTTELNLSVDAFPRVLRLALCFDWIPRGTEAPSDELEATWDGNYFEMLGQCVTAEDANDLAKALEVALSTLPEFGKPELPIQCQMSLKDLMIELEKGLYIPGGEERSELLYSFYNYVPKKKLKRLIKLCKTGEGFVIL